MKKTLSVWLLLALATVLLTGCKDDVNLSDIDTNDIQLEGGIAAPLAYSTTYGTKLYEINSKGYYVSSQPDGTILVSMRARKRVPITSFDATGVTVLLTDSIDLSDLFDTKILKDSHFPIIDPYFMVYFRTNNQASIDAHFSDIKMITSHENVIPSDIAGSNIYDFMVNTKYQTYRTGHDSADYVHHYLDSLVILNKEVNMEKFFDLPPGELPQYLQYDFTLKRIDCQDQDTIFLDGWYCMPVNAKGVSEGDKWGWILNYYDTLEVDGRDFYDEEVDSLIRKHADFVTLYIDGLNATPFNLSGTFYYLDEHKRPLGTGYENGAGYRMDRVFIPGPEVNADGRVVQTSLKPFPTQTIELGKPNEVLADTTYTRLTAERHLVRDMRYIVINARATAPKNGDHVHMVNTDFLDIKLSAKVHAHAKMSDF